MNKELQLFKFAKLALKEARIIFFTSIFFQNAYFCINNRVIYATINGTYENGKIVMEETLSVSQRTPVYVVFVETTPSLQPQNGVKLGSLEGKGFSIPDDFNEPLDNLKDYM